MKVVTVAEMVAIEKRADQEYGLTSPILMEHAGRSVAEAIQNRLEGEVGGLRIVVLAGPGNNGGDGRVAARYLGEWGRTSPSTTGSVVRSKRLDRQRL